MEPGESKAVSVSYEDALAIVVARVFGKALHSDHLAAREESKQLCRDKHCSKLLVDLRGLNTELSTSLDCFAFGRTMSRDLSGLRVAFVIPKDGKSMNDLRFTLKVGEHPNVIVAEFASYEVAVEWLQKGL